MEYGIVQLSIIPVRQEPSHKSEQVSQLLFGETYMVTKHQENWLHITCTYDGYEGWIDGAQHSKLSEKDFQHVSNGPAGIALELASSAVSSSHSIPILAGSTLPFYDGLNFKISKEKFIYNGQAVQPDINSAALLERIAVRYLGAPYLWGGRNPFGIDCSGFTQIVYKFLDIKLLRDAYQQAEQGSIVNFIEEAQTGDLAFFGNDEGRITHVGIILKDSRIIHSSGKVRMDRIDHFGIYNDDLKKYSHKLKIIRRVL
jgi:hypothetical protein